MLMAKLRKAADAPSKVPKWEDISFDSNAVSVAFDLAKIQSEVNNNPMFKALV